MDQKIKDAVLGEENRQRNTIELIASENIVSSDIRELQGSVLTNKYAEGYPGKRYYGGTEFVDITEQLAIDYAKELFKVSFANVQPHSGSNANMAAYSVLVEPGDTILGMDLSAGGHLTHGSPVSFSGKTYHFVSYGVDENGYLDYEAIELLARTNQPKLIVAGASAYSREINFKKFREIADLVGAKLMVDMAHIAGLVATGHHMSPIPYADVVTSTTHKTLRGPRGGLILTNNAELAKKIDFAVFPQFGGGPLEHVIAAKAQAFYEALQPEFTTYIDQVVKNAKAMAKVFKDQGFKVISDGTDNHLMLIDVTKYVESGKVAQELLDELNIATNKNSVPNEKLSPFKTSGLRIGTPAITTRGFDENDCRKVAECISLVLKHPEDKLLHEKVKNFVKVLTSEKPILI